MDGPWLVARANVTDPPAWLRRGTKASFGFKAPNRSSFIDGWIYDGFVTEITVCSPTHEPMEPLAEVVLFKRAEPAERSAPASGGVAFGHGEQIITPPGTIIRRPGIGRVLGVR